MKTRTIHAQASPAAVSFYHEKGHVPSYQQAMRFAGEEGRLATLPDIIDARLSTKPEDWPWRTYFTTSTAEYLGVSRGGNRILVVAHGVGPMANLDGMLEAYSHEFKDTTRSNRGGRIPQKQFWDLADGVYGKVAIVDFDDYKQRYQYPFMQILLASEAFWDPLLNARLGPRAEEYVNLHAQYAREWHAELAEQSPTPLHLRMEHEEPFILEVEDAANCSYTLFQRNPKDLASGAAFAHLVSIGALVHAHHTDETHGERQQYESLTCDISCHEWWNGVRFVGIRNKEPITDIDPGANNLRALMEENWKTLLRPNNVTDRGGFFGLMEFGGEFFTQYPKQGERMDTHEPEFRVVRKEKLSGPVEFKTEDVGSLFFKFGIHEVRQLAPVGANAYYFVSDPSRAKRDGKSYHVCDVEFYKVVIDRTLHLPREEAIRANYDLMMSLTSVK